MHILETKLARLQEIVGSLESVVLGFSGGADSTLLLKVSLDVLGRTKVLAVTFHSEIQSENELTHALQLAQSMDAQHLVIEGNELQNDLFVTNPPDRCYYCKLRRYRQLLSLAAERQFRNVIDGSNYSDLADYRPGIKALLELGIKSPLQEAQLTKDDVRALSFKLDLPTWNRPAQACLASRIPYGQRITALALQQVAKAEKVLSDAGFSLCRVRRHGEVARIEVPRQDLVRLFQQPGIDDIVRAIKATGFRYVAVDLEGYRTGSLNELLEPNE